MRAIHERLLLACLFLVIAAPALAERFEISANKDSEIVFTSKALWEKFDGKTRNVTGYLEADLGNLSGAVDLEVVVNLASFDTGMKKRNQHMRDNHLETARFPTATFRAGKILRAGSAGLAPGAKTTLTLEGTLDLHGVKKTYQVDLELERKGDGSIRVTGGFPVMLPDHEISRPKKLVVKLAEKQEVKIDLLASPAR